LYSSALPRLIPLLIVRNAADAVDFYIRALGAIEIARFLHPAQKTLSHADLSLGNARFAVTGYGQAAVPSDHFVTGTKNSVHGIRPPPGISVPPPKTAEPAGKLAPHAEPSISPGM
jgi:catechol 2,3-dioxygenase-like lactoylglutathione lyase family enzyme